MPDRLGVAAHCLIGFAQHAMRGAKLELRQHRALGVAHGLLGRGHRQVIRPLGKAKLAKGNLRINLGKVVPRRRSGFDQRLLDKCVRAIEIAELDLCNGSECGRPKNHGPIADTPCERQVFLGDLGGLPPSALVHLGLGFHGQP